MASPQTEEGYTKIANELLEALASIRIPGEAMQVLLVIIRKTYGFQKKSDKIALAQFSTGTGLNKQAVCRAIKKLEQMSLIFIKKDNVIEKDKRQASEYAVNKDFEKWRPLSKKITLSKKIKNVIEKDNLPLSKKIPSKETITKEKRNIPAKNLQEQKINGWALWVDANRSRKRADPIPTGADTKAAKMLVEHIKDLQTIKDVLLLFLDDDDAFLQRSGHALRHISGRVNAYINQAENLYGVPDDDEALKVLIEIENAVAAEEKAKNERNLERPAGVN